MAAPATDEGNGFPLRCRLNSARSGIRPPRVLAVVRTEPVKLGETLRVRIY
jgi:hypothetical protein